jgi:hypothetical protein
MNSKTYYIGESTKTNCNVCTCLANGEMVCDSAPCLIEAEIIENVNNLKTSWNAANNSQFWGFSLDQGYEYFLGTHGPTDEVIQMTQVDSMQTPDDIPSQYDHRQDHGSLGIALDQGLCGASYAFSTIALMNARINLASKTTVSPRLSTQELVSCVESAGCGGGYITHAWFYFNQNGVSFESFEGEACYVYNSGKNNETGTCESTDLTCSETRFMSSPSYRLACEEDIMRDIINYGPVQALIKVAQDFFHYDSGVYHSTMEVPVGQDYYHSVILLGWGQQDGIPYWIGRNSWGEQWGECDDGECGFFKIVRGSNESLVESFVVAAHPDLHGHLDLI